MDFLKEIGICFLYIFYWSSIYQHSITLTAHPLKCPPQCPSPSHPIPLPTSPSTTPCLFPRVRSLSYSVILSNFSLSFSLLSPIIPFTISYIPLMNEMQYNSAIRNNEYPPFALTRMELEGIMLSEISQSLKDKHYMVSFIWGI